MGFGRGKNRRRSDSAERAEAMKSIVSRAGSLFVRAGAVAAVLAVLFYGGRHAWTWATHSPAFALRSITVTGTHRADGADLTRLAGLAEGENLFELDVGAATRAIEGHPWVRTARVTRHFPHGVSVEVEEHEPSALVSLGELYLVDKQGEPFKKLTAGDRLDLPLLTGLGREDYVKQPEATEALLREALEAASGFERLSEIHLGQGELTVFTATGTEVRFGAEVSKEKLARWARVRAELKRRGLLAEVIHLDNRVRPGWVTVKVSTPLSERKQGSN